MSVPQRENPKSPLKLCHFELFRDWDQDNYNWDAIILNVPLKITLAFVSPLYEDHKINAKLDDRVYPSVLPSAVPGYLQRSLSEKRNLITIKHFTLSEI
jgi:hypothetical protein